MDNRNCQNITNLSAPQELGFCEVTADGDPYFPYTSDL